MGPRPNEADLPPFTKVGVERCEQLWRGRQRHHVATGSQDLEHLGEKLSVEPFETGTNRYLSLPEHLGHDQV
jgi:hypothetical protein